jgi:catechol 2,3-dioxygenase-like lactoylglutathione lyase family enzyme
MCLFNELKIILPAENYDEELFFYRDALGLEPYYTWDVKGLNRGTCFYFCGAKLEIVSVPDSGVFGKSSVLAGSAGIDGCYAAVEAAGSAQILSGPEGDGMFVFQDPAGHIITVKGSSKGGRIEWGRKSHFDIPLGVLVPVSDMEKSRSFYSELLGLKAENHAENPCFAIGRSFLELTLSGQRVSNLGLEAQNVNACFRELKERGISFLTDLRDLYYGVRLFRIRDPGGNVIEIYSWLENIRDAEAAG